MNFMWISLSKIGFGKIDLSLLWIQTFYMYKINNRCFEQVSLSVINHDFTVANAILEKDLSWYMRSATHLLHPINRCWRHLWVLMSSGWQQLIAMFFWHLTVLFQLQDQISNLKWWSLHSSFVGTIDREMWVEYNHIFNI